MKESELKNVVDNVIRNNGCKIVLHDDDDIKEMEEIKNGVEYYSNKKCYIRTELNQITKKVTLVLEMSDK